MWATSATPHRAGCSYGQYVGPAPGFPGRWRGPLPNPPLAGRKHSNNVRKDRSAHHNTTKLGSDPQHLNLNPDESSLFQEPTPTDPIATTAHKAKSDTPRELRGFMAVVGEIVQERLRAQRREDDKIARDGRQRGDKHESSDVRESEL